MVARRADRIAERVGLLLRRLDQVGEFHQAALIGHHEDRRDTGHDGKRRQISHRIVLKLPIQRDICGQGRGRADQNGMAVGGRAQHRPDADDAVGARLVLDDHGLAAELCEPLRIKARPRVRDAPGCKRNDKTNDLRRKHIPARRATRHGHGKHGGRNNRSETRCRPNAHLRPQLLACRLWIMALVIVLHGVLTVAWGAGRPGCPWAGHWR